VVAASTGLAVVLVEASGENSIVVAAGANAQVAPDPARLALRSGDVLVAQGEVPLDVTVAALAAGRAAGATTVWNPAPANVADRAHLDLADVLVVNETELAVLAQGTDDRLEVDRLDVDRAVFDLARRSGGDVVATLGRDGVVALVGGEHLAVPARAVHVVDTTGAGDCFVGALAASLARGDDLRAAIELAVVASSLAVQRPGAAGSMPTSAEVASAAPHPS
jgi:ribokinase